MARSLLFVSGSAKVPRQKSGGLPTETVNHWVPEIPLGANCTRRLYGSWLRCTVGSTVIVYDVDNAGWVQVDQDYSVMSSFRCCTCTGCPLYAIAMPRMQLLGSSENS
jgi:hypothetical protein